VIANDNYTYNIRKGNLPGFYLKERNMANKIKSVHGGKMRVGVPEGHQVYEKKIPKKLKESKNFKKYDWLGNFGFKVKSTGKKVTGNFNKSYEIQIENRPKKDLVYWNGKKIVKFTGTKVKKVGNVKYRTAKLKMGDPPIGWAN
jgi:hypothetical protein